MEAGGPSSSVVNEEADDVMELPPGFRFHPTDEEIIIHYLVNKVIDRQFTAKAIVEADLNKCEPWDLPEKSKIGEKEWFFFYRRDRKYPTGMRTNRATEAGYWKATGKDKEIYYKRGRNCLVGMKKTLVFYKGRAPKGEKSNWVMHEYRLEGTFSHYNFSRGSKEDWVICKVFDKSTGVRKIPAVELSRIDSFNVDHLLDSPKLPPLTDISYNNNNPNDRPSSSFDHKPFNLLITNDPIPYNNSTFSYQEGINGSTSSYHPIFHFKGSDHQPTANMNLLMPQDQRVLLELEKKCKSERFSGNNSMISHSQETGLSPDIATEGDIESKRPFEDLDGLSFIPNISDLDSLWRY